MLKTKLFVIIGILLFSCQQEKSPYFQTILKTEKGHFRGINIGAVISEIKAVENEAFLMDKSYDYLHYDYEIDMGNSYTATYDFSENNQLYEIEITVFLDKINDANLLFENFKTHFTGKYGKEHLEEDGYITWETNTNNLHGNIEFAIKNESISYGIITIKIRDLDY